MKQRRDDFPFFKNHPGLVYLDSAATTQKPQQMIDALTHFYTVLNAPLHRGIYRLAEEVTEQFEKTRAQVASFINAAHVSEIIFTGGATAALNMVAQGWGTACLQEGDEVVVTQLEHHSNFVPWQRLCAQKKAILRIVPVTDQGVLDFTRLDAYITKKTKMVAVTHVSNAIGTIVDLTPLTQRARAVGARVLVDGCQAAPYQPINVQHIDCDFYVFSAHKMMGPTGVGVLYARQEVHEEFTPPFAGGGTVFQVTDEKTTFLKSPRCYEAGTPPVAQVIGFSAAISYLQRIGMAQVNEYVSRLTRKALEGLLLLPHIQVIGPIEQLEKEGHLVSFKVKGMHAHDVAAYLDQFSICVRAGHHCVQPLAKRLSYDASVRASFYVYTTDNDIELLIQALATLGS